jgi:hypothetical protein
MSWHFDRLLKGRPAPRRQPSLRSVVWGPLESQRRPAKGAQVTQVHRGHWGIAAAPHPRCHLRRGRLPALHRQRPRPWPACATSPSVSSGPAATATSPLRCTTTPATPFACCRSLASPARGPDIPALAEALRDRVIRGQPEPIRINPMGPSRPRPVAPTRSGRSRQGSTSSGTPCRQTHGQQATRSQPRPSIDGGVQVLDGCRAAACFKQGRTRDGALTAKSSNRPIALLSNSQCDPSDSPDQH